MWSAGTIELPELRSGIEQLMRQRKGFERTLKELRTRMHEQGGAARLRQREASEALSDSVAIVKGKLTVVDKVGVGHAGGLAGTELAC